MISENIKILLIEDNPGDIRLVEEMLKEVMPIRYDIIETRTLEDSLSRLQKYQFDVIILDLGLPDSQGIITFEKLLPKAGDAAVIVVTGLNDEKVGIQVIRNGAQDYLVKNSINANLLGKSLQYAIERKKVEKALLGSQRLLKEAQALGRIGNWEFDFVIQKITWSDEVYVLYERDKNLGPPSVEEEAKYYTEEQAKKLHEYAKLAIETGREFRYDLVANLPSGNTCIFDASMHPVMDAGGRVVKLFGTVQDISERKRAEEELRKSENKYRNLVENLQEGIWVIDKDSNTTFVNQPMTDMLQYTTDEMMGKHLFFFMDERGKELATKNLEQRRQGIKDQHEFEFTRKDGDKLYALLETSPIIDDKGNYAGAIAGVVDITERKRYEEKLLSVNRSMKILSECNSCLVRATNEKDFLNDVCQIIKKNGEYSMVWIGFIDAAEKDIVRPVAYAGTEPVDYKSVKIDLADPDVCYTMLRSVVANGEFQKRQNLASDCQPCFGPKWPADRPCRSILSLPLIFDNRTKGALTIYSTKAEAFDDNETKLLLELTDDISYGITTLRMRIHNLQVEEQVKMSLIRAETALESTVKALGVTSELRDPYTAGHQRRVTQLASAIAREMGFTEDRIDGIRVAGLLHDIGKIMIPAEILTKPSKLTDVEFAIVKTHSRASYDILKSIEFPWPVAQIVIQHHEKLNGSGYPSGLKGDEILMESRILCVADIVEAMSSHRPYRPALGIDVALNDMRQNRDILYDPAVVDACVNLFEKKNFKWEAVKTI